MGFGAVPDSRLADAAARRVLIGIHGYEPDAYGRAIDRVLSMWAMLACRVVVVREEPPSRFTSLVPSARTLYRAALADERGRERARLQDMVDDVVHVLPKSTTVVWVTARRRDPARILADHAREWPADVLVVAPPQRAALSRLWPGVVHQRVVRRATCAVLVVSPTELDRGGTRASPLVTLWSLVSGRKVHPFHGAA